MGLSGWRIKDHPSCHLEEGPGPREGGAELGRGPIAPASTLRLGFIWAPLFPRNGAFPHPCSIQSRYPRERSKTFESLFPKEKEGLQREGGRVLSKNQALGTESTAVTVPVTACPGQMQVVTLGRREEVAGQVCPEREAGEHGAGVDWSQTPRG